MGKLRFLGLPAKAAFAALLALSVVFSGCRGNSPDDPDPVDKTALETALTAANSAKSGVTASGEGTDVFTATLWVTPDQLSAFYTAIAAAQVVYDNADANQAAVDNAATTLETATAAFTGQKQAGSKVVDGEPGEGEPGDGEPGPAPTYGISLNQTGTHTFPAAAPGYGTQTVKSITMTKTGNQATGALTVSLSGTDSESFTLSTQAVSSIAAGGTDTFTVVPNTGLVEGTYTATVTVSGENSITAN
jgi:hypothetical protein